MNKLSFDYIGDSLFVFRDGKIIDAVLDSELSKDRGLMKTLSLLQCFSVEPPLFLPDEFLTNINRNNALHALIARVKQLKGYDVADAISEIENSLDPEDEIDYYDTDITSGPY